LNSAPFCVDAPAARLPFQDALVTVTVFPDWDQVPDQPWVSVWFPANVKVTVHPVSALEPAVMFRPIWNPLPQSLTTEYVAVHAAAAFAAGAAAIAASPAQPSVTAATVETTTRALPFPGEPRHRGALNLIRFLLYRVPRR
jgi:hypothetical protein